MDVVLRVSRLPELLILVPDLAIGVRIVGHVDPALSILCLLFGLLYFPHFILIKLVILFLFLGELPINIDILNMQLVVSEVAEACNVHFSLLQLPVTCSVVRVAHSTNY